MHEYSIVSSLIATAEVSARQHGATAIHALTVRIGELSGVDPDLLETAFEIARTETMCAGATLAIERVPIRWVCRGCGCDISAGDVLRCASCGAPARLAGGDEIVLAQLQLEVVDV